MRYIRQPVDTARQLTIGAGAALMALAANVIVSETLEPSIVPLFFGAVVVAAWLGGTLAGVTAAAICLPGIMFLSSPRYEIEFKGGDEVLRVMLFAAVSALMITIDAYRRLSRTAEREALDSVAQGEQRLRVALAAGRMGTWEWDIPGQRITVSQDLEEAHGVAPGTFGGTPLDLLLAIHPEEREATQLAISASLATDAPDLDIEYKALLPDGSTRWFAAKGRVIRNAGGLPVRVVGVAWDITERKLAEIALRESEEELRLANAAKDEFLGMVSHELRTPITTIYTGAHLLRERHGQLDPATVFDVLSDVEQESERLQLIVENLLALARSEFGQQAESEPISVGRTIDRLLRRFRKIHPARNIAFEGSAYHAYASIVPIYLDLVLRNVLDNAHKYGSWDEAIEVAAGIDGDDVWITVRDHGPGVETDDTERIFERFYRAPGSRAKVAGAGIGLTVCRRLIESQGGSITSRNHPEGGLEVSVRLPVYREPGEQEPAVDLRRSAQAG